MKLNLKLINRDKGKKPQGTAKVERKLEFVVVGEASRNVGNVIQNPVAI